MNRLLLVPAPLLIALLLPAPALAACTPITQLPITIAASGNYCLADGFNVTSLAEPAITIQAHFVNLDCERQIIRYAGAPAPTNNVAAIHIQNAGHVTISNCRIQGGFGIGIQASQASLATNNNKFITIEDNIIEKTRWYGILAYGTGLRITGNRIFDVALRDNSFSMGIRVGSATGAGAQHVVEVRDNFVSGTTADAGSYAAYGIYSENAVNGVFVGNTVLGTTGAFTWGIRLGGNNNVVTDNRIFGSNLSNDVGIQSNSATDACYDNHIRATTKTAVCDAALGNY